MLIAMKLFNSFTCARKMTNYECRRLFFATQQVLMHNMMSRCMYIGCMYVLFIYSKNFELQSDTDSHLITFWCTLATSILFGISM